MILEFLSPRWFRRNEELLPAPESPAELAPAEQGTGSAAISSIPLCTPFLKDYCNLCRGHREESIPDQSYNSVPSDK